MSFDFQAILPELFVFTVASIVLVVDLYLPAERRGISYGLSLVALAGGAMLAAAGFGGQPEITLNGMFIDDAFADLVKAAVCLVTLVVFVYSRDYAAQRGFYQGEYFVLGLYSVVGMMVIASANNMLVLYMGLELMSLCLYALVAFQRDSSLATEAAMKYFVLGALGSGMLLYGMSILYGLTGTLDIGALREAVAKQSPDNLALVLGLVFVLVSLAFKLGTVPFHMWVPDVYHGAPTSSTMLVGAAPKIAGLAMIIRLLVGGLEDLHLLWRDMLIVLSVLSIGIGNLIAIAQVNFKRMLAYSAISHMGFMLLGVLAGTTNGYSSALFYSLVYAVSSMGAFGMIVLLSRAGFEADLLDDLTGLNRRHPWYAFLLLLLMVSMAGVPPTIGFFAKLSVIQAVVEADLVWLAVLAVLFAVVGAFYYLRVIKIMYFDAPVEEPRPVEAAAGLRFVISTNACAMVLLLPFIGPIQEVCIRAIESLAR
jgi:NADH-quinone oxidoreductase subunit N